MNSFIIIIFIIIFLEEEGGGGGISCCLSFTITTHWNFQNCRYCLVIRMFLLDDTCAQYMYHMHICKFSPFIDSFMPTFVKSKHVKLSACVCRCDTLTDMVHGGRVD